MPWRLLPRVPPDSRRHALFQFAPHSLVRLQSFRRRYGWRATLARIAQELRGRTVPPGPTPAAAPDHPAAGSPWAPIARGDTTASAPLRFYLTPRRNRQRVTLIGERLDLRHPSDAATTALILATLTANRLGADLRVVTRLQAMQPDQLDELLQLHRVALQGEAVFQFVPIQGPDTELDRFDDELFLVTSWSSAAATLAMVPPGQVVYLVQADERPLQPAGEARAQCEALLHRQDLRFVVHTRRLKDHLADHGLPHLQHGAMSFEPAFPVRPQAQGPRAGRRRFVFHAAAAADRDLLRLGLATIEKALTLGVLQPARWELLFLGRDMPEVVLANGQRPRHVHDLDGAAYLQLLAQADLGLSLHPGGLPGRTPLDLAASGAIVVLNDPAAAPGKPGQAMHNLIHCATDVDALLDGLRTAVGLVEDDRRPSRQGPPTLAHDWAHTLHDTLEHLARPARPAPAR